MKEIDGHIHRTTYHPAGPRFYLHLSDFVHPLGLEELYLCGCVHVVFKRKRQFLIVRAIDGHIHRTTYYSAGPRFYLHLSDFVSSKQNEVTFFFQVFYFCLRYSSSSKKRKSGRLKAK